MEAEREKAKGNECMKRKEYTEAIEAYTRALRLKEDNAVVLSNRAQAFILLGKFAEALEDSEKAVRIDPSYLKAYHRKGKSLSHLHRYSEAIPCFQHILASEPHNSDALAELQKCRSSASPESSDSGLDVGFPTETMSDSEDALSEALSFAASLKQAGNASFQSGNFPLAISQYESALNLLLETTTGTNLRVSEEKAALFNNLAACYNQTGELEKVVACCTSVLAVTQPNRELKEKALLRRALAYEKLEKVELAKGDMELVKEIDPGNMQASQALQRYAKLMLEDSQKKVTLKAEETESFLRHMDAQKAKGNSCFERDDIDQAIAEFTAGIRAIQTKIYADIQLRTNPAFTSRLATFLSNRAAAYLKMNCNAQVISDCKAALALDQSFGKALYRMAQGQQNCGLLTDAIESLEKFLELDPKNEQAKREIASIRGKLAALSHVAADSTPHRKGQRKVSFKASADDLPIESFPDPVPTVAEPSPIIEISVPKVEAHSLKPTKPILTADIVAEAKHIASALIPSLETIPASSTSFQTYLNSLKTDLMAVGEYVTRLDFPRVVSLFEHSELELDLILLICKGLETVKPAGGKVIEVLEGFEKTYRFDLTVKMLNKDDKRMILRLIEGATDDEETRTGLKAKYRVG